MPHIQSWSSRDYAVFGLSLALNALVDAETFGCGDDEIMGLCDEVIRRRLTVQLEALADGLSPAAGPGAQSMRDELLLHQTAQGRPA